MTGQRALVWAGVLSLAVSAPLLWSAPPDGASDSAAQAESGRPRGRLPNHFGKLGISPQQREQIYAVQAEYDERIDELLAQIEQLRTQRNTALEELLTPEQRTRLHELRTEAQSKRKRDQAASDDKPQ